VAPYFAAEMRTYADKLRLPRTFMHDFELFAVVRGAGWRVARAVQRLVLAGSRRMQMEGLP
jgi:hypothetical protein